MMSRKTVLSKDNLDSLFEKLSEKYSEFGGTEPIKIYLVGGTAIMSRFQYRQSTLDADAFFPKTESLLKASAWVAEHENLPSDWLNDAFVGTNSFSQVIFCKMDLYKEYGNGLISVYRLPAVYMIAMKMRSNRPTGGDLDDVLKMIAEIRHLGGKIAMTEIEDAYIDLYGEGFGPLNAFFVKELEEITSLSDEEVEELYYPPLLDF